MGGDFTPSYDLPPAWPGGSSFVGGHPESEPAMQKLRRSEKVTFIQAVFKLDDLGMAALLNATPRLVKRWRHEKGWVARADAHATAILERATDAAWLIEHSIRGGALTRAQAGAWVRRPLEELDGCSTLEFLRHRGSAALWLGPALMNHLGWQEPVTESRQTDWLSESMRSREAKLKQEIAQQKPWLALAEAIQPLTAGLAIAAGVGAFALVAMVLVVGAPAVSLGAAFVSGMGLVGAAGVGALAIGKGVGWLREFAGEMLTRHDVREARQKPSADSLLRNVVNEVHQPPPGPGPDINGPRARSPEIGAPRRLRGISQRPKVESKERDTLG